MRNALLMMILPAILLVGCNNQTPPDRQPEDNASSKPEASKPPITDAAPPIAPAPSPDGEIVLEETPATDPGEEDANPPDVEEPATDEPAPAHTDQADAPPPETMEPAESSDPVATEETQQPSPPQRPEPDPKAMAVLRALEKATNDYTALRADLNYVVQDRITGDRETRTGWIAYQQKTDTTPERYRIHFETLQLDDGPKTAQEIDYLFDGQRLIIVKHNIKSYHVIDVAPPGQTVDHIKFGKSPFPVPSALQADEVVTYLDVVLDPPAETDPAGTDHLRMVPFEDAKDDVNFQRLELWVSRDSHLPVRVRTKTPDKAVTTADFRNIKTRPEIRPEWFRLPPPKGYDVVKESSHQ